VECDIWAFGCLAFRLLTGSEAFVDQQLGEKDIFENIQEVKYSIASIECNEARTMVEGILKNDVKKRLTIAQIKKLPYFSDVNWNEMFKNLLAFEEERFLRERGDSVEDAHSNFNS